MGKFKPARFGNAAVNTVTGELKIEGATVIDSITVTDSATIPADISLVLIAPAGVGTKTLTLPGIADVPSGHTITFKKSTAALNAITLIGDVNIDGTASKDLLIRWQAVTICSNGTIWNIIRYFDGSI